MLDDPHGRRNRWTPAPKSLDEEFLRLFPEARGLSGEHLGDFALRELKRRLGDLERDSE